MPLILGGIVVTVIVVAIGAGILINSSQQNKSSTTPNAGTNQMSITDETVPTDDDLDTDTPAMNDSTTSIAVEGGSYYFKPNEIKVTKGKKVKITLNSVSMMHNFVIDELNVKSPIVQAGDTATIEFTPDKAGTYEFYCSVGNHRQMGMVGKLIVE